MTVTELIANLERAREKHGDLPCYGAWEGQTDLELAVMFYPGSAYRKQAPRILLDSDCLSDGTVIE